MKRKFFDNAKNHTNPANASAIARARRDAVENGDAYTVNFDAPDGTPMYWNGCRYDVLALAKSLTFNRYDGLAVISPNGQLVDIAAATY